MKIPLSLLVLLGSLGICPFSPSICSATSGGDDEGEEERPLTPAEQRQGWRNDIRANSLESFELSLYAACIPDAVLAQEEPRSITEQQAEAIETCVDRRTRNYIAQLSSSNRALGVNAVTPALARTMAKQVILEFASTDRDDPEEIPE